MEPSRGNSEDAVYQKCPEDDGDRGYWNKGDYTQFDNHQYGGENQQSFTSEQVSKGARRYLTTDDGDGPDGIE